MECENCELNEVKWQAVYFSVAIVAIAAVACVVTIWG